MLMLLFYADKEAYCCSCEQIIEIIPKIPLKAIPHVPSHIIGLLNYGGESVPVIDYSMLVTDKPTKNSMHTRIILVKNPTPNAIPAILGLAAEEIVEVREIDSDLFMDTGVRIKDLPFMDGIYNYEKESIQQISLNQLFNFIKPAIES